MHALVAPLFLPVFGPYYGKKHGQLDGVQPCKFKLNSVM